jgi:hypothetical protein
LLHEIFVSFDAQLVFSLTILIAPEDLLTQA